MSGIVPSRDEKITYITSNSSTLANDVRKLVEDANINAHDNPKGKYKSTSDELRIFEPQIWILFFTSAPVWLFTLTPQVIVKLYLPQIKGWTEFRRKIEISVGLEKLKLYDSIVIILGR